MNNLENDKQLKTINLELEELKQGLKALEHDLSLVCLLSLGLGKLAERRSMQCLIGCASNSLTDLADDSLNTIQRLKDLFPELEIKELKNKNNKERGH